MSSVNDLENTLSRLVIAQGMQSPHFHLADYMERFWVTPNPKDDPTQMASARLHHILRPDDDDVFHDHPWDSVTLILMDGYTELVPLFQNQHPCMDNDQYEVKVRQQGDIIFRKATDRHRIVSLANPEAGSWSLFMMGPWAQDWSFHTPTGKVFWREHLNEWREDPPPGSNDWNVRKPK